MQNTAHFCSVELKDEEEINIMSSKSSFRLVSPCIAASKMLVQLVSMWCEHRITIQKHKFLLVSMPLSSVVARISKLRALKSCWIVIHHYTSFAQNHMHHVRVHSVTFRSFAFFCSKKLLSGVNCVFIRL